MRSRIADIAARHGLELVGVTSADPLPQDRARMEESVADGRMARMDWMGGERPRLATEPAVLEPGARSVIVVAAPYIGNDRASWDPAPGAMVDALASVLRAEPRTPAGRIARYALGTDYHVALRERLGAMAAELRDEGLAAGEVAYVDDRPLAERALAARAGLGWIGKNSNLLTHHRAGSWVFLGAVLTSAELPADEPVRTNCGSCTRCITGCPTGAIVAPQTIDARRCISYLTIEHPGVLGAWEARAIGDWIFGCDVCQEVCPVNADADDSGPLLVPLIPLIAWLLPMGGRAFGRAVGRSALTRAGRHRLLRNAVAALGNAGELSSAARSVLEQAARDSRSEVRAQARRVLDGGIAWARRARRLSFPPMPRVSPFRGLEYSQARFGEPTPAPRIALPGDTSLPPTRVADLTDLACPPYDVIDADRQSELLARDEHNAVRLELSAEPDPHAAAAETLKAWLADGTLERRDEPTAYAYRHANASAPDELVVGGIVVRVLLEPWGPGIRPHEHTMPGPKADRLALLQATRTQLSPILSVYFDRSNGVREAMGRAGVDEWRARDDDGLLHQLAVIEPDEQLLDHLRRQTLYIADGHHRYETALAYQAGARADPQSAGVEPGGLAADWIMMMLVNAELTDLEIRPTHRLLMDADADALGTLIAGNDVLFTAIPIGAEGLAAALEERRHADEPVFGLVMPDGEGYLLVGDPDGITDRLRREHMSSAVRSLDLAALHVALLDDRLGITAADVAAGNRLAYTRDEADARRRVARGEAAAAILVRPTRMDQLAEVARAGDVMPQKSTYFYPKLLTGMVFNPLED